MSFLVMNALASLVSQISGGWNTLWAIARPISLSLMWVGSCFLGGPENAAKSCEEVLCFFRFLIASIGFTPTESRMFYLPALKKKGRRVLFHSNESEMRVTTLHTHTHCTLVRLRGSSPVYLCHQTKEGQVDRWQWGGKWNWNIWGLWHHNSL